MLHLKQNTCIMRIIQAKLVQCHEHKFFFDFAM